MTEKEEPSIFEMEIVRARGSIIHLVVMLEHVAEDIIMMHFCKRDRAIEFRHVVLSKEQFSLKMKSAVLWFIIKNHYPELAKENPKFKTEFDSIIDLRNDFAHKKFDSGNSNLEEAYLKHYSVEENKIKTKRIPVSKEKLVDNLELIARYGNILLNLQLKMLKELGINPEELT